MGWTTAGMPDGEIGGWMDSWMKNTKKISEGKIQGRQPAEKPQDRWIDMLTRDARNLLRTAGWKNWHYITKQRAEKLRILGPEISLSYGGGGGGSTA